MTVLSLPAAAPRRRGRSDTDAPRAHHRRRDRGPDHPRRVTPASQLVPITSRPVWVEVRVVLLHLRHVRGGGPLHLLDLRVIITPGGHDQAAQPALPARRPAGAEPGRYPH